MDPKNKHGDSRKGVTRRNFLRNSLLAGAVGTLPVTLPGMVERRKAQMPLGAQIPYRPVKKSTRITHGDKYLKILLVQCAWAATRTKNRKIDRHLKQLEELGVEVEIKHVA